MVSAGKGVSANTRDASRKYPDLLHIQKTDRNKQTNKKMSDGNHASSCKGRVSVITASPQCAHEMECAPNRTMNPPPPEHWRRRHIGVMFSSLGHPRAYRACGGGRASSPGGRDRIPGDRIYGLVRTAHSSYIRPLSRSTRFRRRVYLTRERGLHRLVKPAAVALLGNYTKDTASASKDRQDRQIVSSDCPL